MEELAAQQKAIADKIQDLARNFGKDSSERKTIVYLEQRLSVLEAHWRSFDANNQQILQIAEQHPDHPYVLNSFFAQTRKLTEKFREDLNELWRAKQVFNPSKGSEANGAGSSGDKGAETNNAGGNIESSGAGSSGGKGAKTNIAGGNIANGAGSSGAGQQPSPRRQRRLDTQMQVIRRLLTAITAERQELQSRAYYQIMTKTLSSHWEALQQMHVAILEDDLYADYDPEYFINLEEEIIPAIIELKTRLEDTVGSTEDLAQIAPPRVAGTSFGSLNIKLPKMTLPVFKGDYLQWKQFEELFSEIIGKQNISNTQKLMYLKANLDGEPKNLIHHLQITELNYQPAWEILCSRYENKRLIVTGLLDKLLSQSNIQNDSAAAIKSLHDTTLECLSALRNIGMPIAEWSSLLHHILIRKIDKATHGLYEQSLQAPREVPQLEDLLKFLELRFQALEALGAKNRHQITDKSKKAVCLNTTKDVCLKCKGDHMVHTCSQFLKMSPSERYQSIVSAKACINCLKEGHWTVTCRAKKCTKCSRKHNILLHRDEIKAIEQASSSAAVVAVSSLAANTNNTHVFLGTVIANVKDYNGKSIECRILLDSGSQLNFISEKLYKQLGLRYELENLNISGIGRSQLQASKRVNLSIQSRHTGFTARVEAFVLPKIASDQPNTYIDTKEWKIPQNINLADSSFNQPRKIDMLLGAEFFCSLLSIGQIRLGDALPTLQNTVFGWIIVGKATNERSSESFCGISIQEDMNLDKQVKKFWELEDAEASAVAQTTAERDCEAYFKATTVRNESGRFVVRLPFTANPSVLGQSSDIAIRRFFSLERRLNKDPALKRQYVEFIKEYLDLNHMEEIKPDQLANTHYILPHHCVLRPESTTTKLRVVFDASAKTSNNIALNEILATGPTIQNDLFSILTRFRIHRFVFTGDIAKMYRQILIDERDRNLQIIVWRNNENESLKYYRLRTVTYGTTSAPYLSIKCLQTLGNQYSDIYPNGSRATRDDFYVDDLMTGCDDILQAKTLQKEIITILKSGSFELRKWCANHPQLLQDMPASDCQLQFDIDDGTTGQIKALGVTWLPKADQFAIKTSWEPAKRVTKRSILADIAHVFDPLGFVNPVIVLAKIFIQELWSLKLDWDSAVPAELHTKWLRFREELVKLNELKIPRHVLIVNPVNIQLHAFSDASEKAYGAAIYVRSVNKNGQVTVRLLCAKSKVAPKKTITLPRLELCAAKLTAQLAKRVKECLNIQVNKTVFWTDSSIVLSWLQSESSTYKTFVANRVAVIQELTKDGAWNHISTKLNPADLVSRGVFPKQLIKSTFWFEGPGFLKLKEEEWPVAERAHQKQQNSNMEERRLGNTVLLMQEDQHSSFIHKIDHRNSFQHLKMVVAQILRFIKNVRATQANRKIAPYFNIHDLEEAERVILKELQAGAFHIELAQLKRNQNVLQKSSLAGLTPFLDDGLIHVGGRIQAADIPVHAKHPILIPNHEISRILMSDLHRQHLHAGPQLLLAITRQRYWPLQGKNMARSVVHKCVLCAKANPTQLTQRMGNLPEERLRPARPFLHVGVDFCGPIEIHYKLRGKRATKSYIAVFVCFTTKAVHLEVASDLTTAAFIGCLKRFIGRRGLPSKIFCDNATNFVGAKNELEDWNDILKTKESQAEINKHCSQKGIDWKFIPARAPHFGGLWEAAVKSTKHHLKRIMHNSSLTFEELATLTTEIEAILNSRPLTVMSDDPNDLQPLTPGHFLIGEPMTSIPGRQTATKTTSAKRWDAIRVHKEEFWKRWSIEYLSELQRRNKWRSQGENISPGRLVILKEDNIPSLQWRTGRVLKTIQGPDGLVRVAEIKTSTGTTTRAIHRICPLPIDEEEEIMDDSTMTAEDEKLKSKQHTVLYATATRPHKLKGRFLPINCNWNTKQHTEAATNTKKDEIAAFSGDLSIQTECRSRKRHVSSSSSVKDRDSFTGGASASKVSKVMLLMCTLIALTAAAPIQNMQPEQILEPYKNYSIRKIDAPSGIYYEEIGRAHLITNEWNLIVFFDLQTYWLEFQELKKYIDTMKSLCHLGQLKTKGYCNATMDQFAHQLTLIEQKNQLLQNNNELRGSRQRRSPFNIIGTVAHSLFGILDNDFAEQYEEHIRGLRKNGDYLQKVLQNHSSILEATANIIKKDEESILLQFDDFKYDLKQLADDSEHRQMFSTLALHTTLAMSNYQRTQDALLSVVADTQHGLMSPELLTPKQIHEQLNLIRKTIPHQLSIPTTNDADDLLQTYKLFVVKGRVTKRYVIISLKLPLVDNEYFQLFNIVPVPILHEGRLVSIKPATKKILINLQRTSYYPMTEAELELCKQTRKDRYLCYQHHPLYTERATYSNCEFTLLTHTKSTPETCMIQSSAIVNTWTPLFNPNNWIFANFQEETVDILCGEHLSAVLLSGTGLIHLGTNCMIKTPTMIIKTHNVFHEEIKTAIIPAPDLSIDLKRNKIQIDNQTYRQESASTILHRIHEQQLREVELPYTITAHDVHQYTLLYTLIAALIIALIVYYVRRCRHQKRLTHDSPTAPKEVEPPKPAPRFKPTLDFNLEEL